MSGCALPTHGGCPPRRCASSSQGRSVPASAEDAVLCDFFARNAVHAAMAGKTGLVIGYHAAYAVLLQWRLGPWLR